MPKSLIIKFFDKCWVGECPVCHQRIKGEDHLLHKDLKEKYKWYEISDQGLYCPHCSTRLCFDEGLVSKLTLTIPLMISVSISIYFEASRYMEGLLGILGLWWWFLWSKKRKLIAAEDFKKPT